MTKEGQKLGKELLRAMRFVEGDCGCWGEPDKPGSIFREPLEKIKAHLDVLDAEAAEAVKQIEANFVKCKELHDSHKAACEVLWRVIDDYELSQYGDEDDDDDD